MSKMTGFNIDDFSNIGEHNWSQVPKLSIIGAAKFNLGSPNYTKEEKAILDFNQALAAYQKDQNDETAQGLQTTLQNLSKEAPKAAKELYETSGYKPIKRNAAGLTESEAIGLEQVLDYDNAGVAEQINNPQKPQENQIQDGVREDLAILDAQAAGGYRKFRNTGVAYFDDQERLGLYDAWLAKKLGLNVSWNYQKIDANIDLKARHADLTKAAGEHRKYLSNTADAVRSVAKLLQYADENGRIKTGFQTIARNKTGAILSNTAAQDLSDAQDAISKQHFDREAQWSQEYGKNQLRTFSNTQEKLNALENIVTRGLTKLNAVRDFYSDFGAANSYNTALADREYLQNTYKQIQALRQLDSAISSAKGANKAQLENQFAMQVWILRESMEARLLN